MKKTLESGLWIEHLENGLKYGRGETSKILRCAPDSTINTAPLHPMYAAVVCKHGKNPEDYISFEAELVPREIILEIKIAIARHTAEAAEKRAAERKEAKDALQSGEVVLVLEIASAYGATLTYGMPGEEVGREWAWSGIGGSPHIAVDTDAASNAIVGRRASGSFAGCENSVWQITQSEWDAILTASRTAKNQKAEARKRYEAAEAADIQSKIDSGFCFSCGSWCHGDCGHFQASPDCVAEAQDAAREVQYGIQADA